MRTRNNRVFLYLNDREMEMFDSKVKKSGLTRSTYLRQLIAGYGPTPSPDERFWSDMNRISELADSIDEIALKEGKPKEILAIIKETKAWRSLRNEIEQYFLVPKKIDTKLIIENASNES